ncbi:restriction endonuclease [Arthrobacter sp. VKM Ac-2550]|uniref:restriction endonuclease n=1 Tax=Crystallibacter permensis TaxID=1938888 RepID=UPI002226B862|nr:restriction endonuclease [Arthrobacter sp. VKM Ac-2550]MCW2133051.1 restriction system protein [Arthrobacter sp. VKM Ac-2550]
MIDDFAATADEPIPKWGEFLHPVLQVLADGKPRVRRDLVAEVLDEAGITPEQRAIMLASGQSKAENRIGWAMSDLTRATAVAKPERGRFVITDLGKQLLAKYPHGFSQNELKEIPAYRDYEPRRQNVSKADPADTFDEDSELDPTEQIDRGIELLRADLATDLLKRLQERHPDFFEEAVVKLMLAMGYGGAENRGRRIGGSGDGGVDGVIDQDALGLDQIYIQAKRYAPEVTVGREAIQGFVGALAGRGATRGVFITTSRFSNGALEYAKSIPTRVILIDGKQLTDLMIRHGVGVQVAKTYTVAEIDEDFFE